MPAAWLHHNIMYVCSSLVEEHSQTVICFQKIVHTTYTEQLPRELCGHEVEQLVYT